MARLGPKESRGGQGSGRGTSKLATSAKDQAGRKIDLSKFPLRYGSNDKNVSGKARTLIENFEEKRLKGKLEYSFATDPDGNALAETRGGKTSVTTPFRVKNNAKVFTHIHPRDTSYLDGYLGGTFSKADLVNWAYHHQNIETYRAAASEGTYSITKGQGFKYLEFSRWAQGEYNQRYVDYTVEANALKNSYKKGNITYGDYARQVRDAFNHCEVDQHNMLIDNQKKYGYTYTLERRKQK